jgi:hypothetical protein
VKSPDQFGDGWGKLVFSTPCFFIFSPKSVPNEGNAETDPLRKSKYVSNGRRDDLELMGLGEIRAWRAVRLDDAFGE